MSGVAIIIDASDLAAAAALVSRLDPLQEDELLSVIGATGEMQTRRRIEEEKTSPDGAAWPPNLEGGSILLRSGNNLRDSVAHSVGAGATEWGASWEFAHVHQFGATIVPKQARFLAFAIAGVGVRAKKVVIPPRPFVGLSAANARELEEVVTDFLGALLGGGK